MTTWEQFCALPLEDAKKIYFYKAKRVIPSLDWFQFEHTNWARYLQTHAPFVVEIRPHVTSSLIFDETNAAIGEDWVWDAYAYYFAREADAVWFTMRWS